MYTYKPGSILWFVLCYLLTLVTEPIHEPKSRTERCTMGLYCHPSHPKTSHNVHFVPTRDGFVETRRLTRETVVTVGIVVHLISSLNQTVNRWGVQVEVVDNRMDIRPKS